MINTDPAFNATATDIALALADLASPQTDDSRADIIADFDIALDQLDCDDQLRAAFRRARDLIIR